VKRKAGKQFVCNESERRKCMPGCGHREKHEWEKSMCAGKCPYRPNAKCKEIK